LHAFHTGRRHYPPMNYLLAYLPEDYLKQIAEYFAAQRPPLPAPADPAVSKDVLERGESLVTHGDAAAGVPACSSCHGPHLTGMEPAIPGLLGLRATYISAQLGAWRYGTRTAAEPDCMQIVAGHLTEWTPDIGRSCPGRLFCAYAGHSAGGPNSRKQTRRSGV